MKRKKGYFSISAVAKMFSVHQQTIRLYEKEGLISPKRSEGNTRLFSEEDVNRLEEIIYLTHELGINLAGVEMIIKLQRQINKLQKEINIVLENAQADLRKDEELSKNLARASAQRLLKLKQGSQTTPVPVEPAKSQERSQSPAQAVEQPLEQWEIHYDE